MSELREASVFLEHLCDRAGVLPLASAKVGYFLSAFLSAARSVTWVLQVEEKDKYDAVYPAWEAMVDDMDLGLLRYMNGQRVAEVHKAGAAVSSAVEYRKVSEVRVERDGHWQVLFTAPPGTPAPEMGFAAHH